MSCGVGRRRGSNLVLPGLWCRLAAIAPIRPLAREPTYAAGAALKSKKKGGGYWTTQVKCLGSLLDDSKVKLKEMASHCLAVRASRRLLPLLP